MTRNPIDTKVSVRQQCMYEGPSKKNLQQINNICCTTMSVNQDRHHSHDIRTEPGLI